MTNNPPDNRSEYFGKPTKDLLEYARTMKDPEVRREVETIAVGISNQNPQHW